MHNTISKAYIDFRLAFHKLLELEVKLCNSTELDSSVIQSEMGEFLSLIEALETHSNRSHIVKFSILNRDEFIRAEREYLQQYRESIQLAVQRVAAMLLLAEREYIPEFSLHQLVEWLEQHAGAKDLYGFSSKHKDMLKTVLQPTSLYGREIADDFFESEPVKEADNPSTDAHAEEIEDTLLNLQKAQMLTRLKKYTTNNSEVIAVVMVKLKRWLKSETRKEKIRCLPLPQEIPIPRAATPGLVMYATNARNLLFQFTGETGISVIGGWFLENSLIRERIPSIQFPKIVLPGVCAAVCTADGTVTGTAYVTASTGGEQPFDAISKIIRDLDFVKEYLYLSERIDAQSVIPEKDVKDQQLLSLAEQL